MSSSSGRRCLVASLGCALLLGCQPGELTPVGFTAGSSDGGDSMAADGSSPADSAPLPACDPAAALPAPADGHHNPGQPCLSCHTAPQGASAPFTVAGTVYVATAGGASVPAATVHLVDATGADVRAVTASNGNFWTTATVKFPLRVLVSQCPEVTPMVATVVASGASCNTCHGTANRIHLP